MNIEEKNLTEDFEKVLIFQIIGTVTFSGAQRLSVPVERRTVGYNTGQCPVQCRLVEVSERYIEVPLTYSRRQTMSVNL